MIISESSPHPRSHRANAEIAQVRGKAQQEQAAYQASLRKEQLRVDALERTLEQKVRGLGSGFQAGRQGWRDAQMTRGWASAAALPG